LDVRGAGGGGGGGGAGGGGGGTKASPVTLSISSRNAGTITSDAGGIDCGIACSATFAANGSVTLTATPPAGKTFANWGGACSGTALTCTLTLTKSTSVQAVFNK
jgi:hypothetical protein